LKILITAYVRFPNALAWHALEVSRGLHRAGHEVYLLCQKKSPLAQWSENEPFHVNRDLNLNRIDPQNVLNGIITMRRNLREFQPDILNPHCPPGHLYLALARRLAPSNAALVRTIAEPRPPKHNFVNQRLYEGTADGVILTTESSRRRYAQVFRLNHAEVTTIHPGFCADEFCATVVSRGYRRQLGLDNGQLLAGIIARMSPEKGQEVLLEALHLLPKEDRTRIHCVIAGPDSRERTRADLVATANGLGVRDHVTFLGPLDDIRPLLAELDLGIITSTRSEAICRIALEYMSFGIPIIASNVNILPEVIRHGDNGWVFPNRDAQTLAGHLREILNSPLERERRGRAGRDLVHNDFSAKNEIQQLVGVFTAAQERRAKRQ
jgi:glycosyltransferase involved in cell wall biosynthesis